MCKSCIIARQADGADVYMIIIESVVPLSHHLLYLGTKNDQI